MSARSFILLLFALFCCRISGNLFYITTCLLQIRRYGWKWGFEKFNWFGKTNWIDLIKIFCFELSAYFGRDWKLWIASHPMKWTSSPLIMVMIWMLLKKGGLHLTKDELPHSFTISSLLTWRSFKLEGKSPNLPFTPAAASARKWNCFYEKRIFSLWLHKDLPEQRSCTSHFKIFFWQWFENFG